MSLDIDPIKEAVQTHGVVARVTIAAVAGSSPRDVGASMLVWQDDQSGTIGGGALEFDAANAARKMLTQNNPKPQFVKIPLGPALGQCCGGTVSLLTELMTAETLVEIQSQIDKYSAFARPVNGNSDMPLAVSRQLAKARAGSAAITPSLTAGWFIEPTSVYRQPLWIYGAGHVGRALVSVFQNLAYDITWIDTQASRFPKIMPDNVTQLIAENPADLVKFAPKEAAHLVLTYSHALDLEICHRLLAHPFASAGLIGSATKWVRFRKRLVQLGHGEAQILRIDCPIGDPALGKAPVAIAIGVASGFLLKANAAQLSIPKEEDVACDHTS